MTRLALLLTVTLLVSGCERERGWIWQGQGEPEPPWNEQRARSLIGKYVIVGLSYEKPDGSLLRQVQLHGRISSADRREGLCVVLEGQKKGWVYRLAPDLRAFQEAAPGEYRLRSTGEVIVDPDLIATWIAGNMKGAPEPVLRRSC